MTEKVRVAVLYGGRSGEHAVSLKSAASVVRHLDGGRFAVGFTRLSEARLRPLGFGVGHLPVLVALRDGRAGTQRDLARFAKVEQPPMAQMLARMERDGLIRRAPDPDDGRSRRVTLTETALARMPEAVAALLRGNREALDGFTEAEAGQLVALLSRLIENLDRLAGVEPPRADAS